MSAEAKKEIGRRISLARRMWGMTQADFAKKVGACQSTVGYWESGERNIPMWRVPGICEALRVSPQHLLGMPEPEGTAKPFVRAVGMGHFTAVRNAIKNS